MAGSETRVDEDRLIKALVAGEWADLTREAGYDPRSKPNLTAAFLRTLVLGRDPRAPNLPAGARIRGVRLDGDLDLADCFGLQGGSLGVLALEECDLPGRISVSNTELTRLSIRKSRFREFWGEGVQVRGDLDFRESSPLPNVEPSSSDSAYIRLRAARIGGDVWGRGAILRPPAEVPRGLTTMPPSLNLWLAKVGGNLSFEERFDCSGGFHLIGATIGGDLDLRGARLSNPEGDALDASGCSIGGRALFIATGEHRFEGEGGFDISGATIGGDLDLRGARLSNPEGDALDASGCSIGGHLRLMSAGDHRFESKGGVSLWNAKVSGDLVCFGSHLSNPDGIALVASGIQIGGEALFNVMGEHRFEAEGEVRILNGSVGRDLNLSGARLSNPEGDALDASGCSIGGKALFIAMGEHRFEGEGGFNFRGATIGGDLNLRGARLSNPEGDALDANGCSIGGDLFLIPDGDHRFESQGGVSLWNAKVSGNLLCSGAHLSNPGKMALGAYGVQIGGEALFDVSGDHRFEAEGEVRILNGSVGRDLNLSGARLSNPEGDALDASDCSIGGDLFLMPDGDHRFESQGRVLLWNAKVSGNLGFGSSRLSNPGKTALDASGVQIGGQLQADDNLIDGEVDLSATRIDVLGSFAPSAWHGADRIKLDGIRISQILVDPQDGVPWKQQRDWLRRSSFRENGAGRIVSPHPWRECASAFARSGRHSDARRLQREGYREENRARPKWQQPFVWLFAETPFGFGLSIFRTTVTVLCFWLVGTVGVEAMSARGVLVATQEGGAPRACRSVVAPLYALDVAVPFIDLRQEFRCDPGDMGQTGLFAGIAIPALSLQGPPTVGATSSKTMRVLDEITLWQWAKAIYALLGALTMGFSAVTYSGVFKPKE